MEDGSKVRSDVDVVVGKIPIMQSQEIKAVYEHCPCSNVPMGVALHLR